MSAGSRTNSPDDWRPGASLQALRARAGMLADLRAYFAAAGVLEVETPLAGPAAGTDPALQPLRARYAGPVYPRGVDLYLQTSPEFAMKRLLAAGSGPIYQICKAFRDGEAGRLHNPEFSILEWYRPGVALSTLIDEVADIARLVLGAPNLAIERHSYAALFDERLGIDVFSVDVPSLRDAAKQHHLLGADRFTLDRDGWLDLLLSHLVQPDLGTDSLCFVTDYPASQAALARLNPDGRTAARFELFHHGIELANGFSELTDADEQRARFERTNAIRTSVNREPVEPDERFLESLGQGLPECAGMALGVDRLVAALLGETCIDDVKCFGSEEL